MKVFLFFSIITFFCSSIGLFQVKSYVHELSKKLINIQKEVKRIEDEIVILEAEWNYLNRPDRLEELANKYIGDRRDIILAQQVYTDYRLIRENDIIVTRKVE